MSAGIRFFAFVMSFLALGWTADRSALGTELAEPAEIEAAGRYVHEPSGMVFPQSVLDFKRVELIRYDKEGLDVSGGYNLERDAYTIVATVYVYPIPKSNDPATDVPAAHFEGVKQAIMAAHPDAKLLQEDKVKVTQGKVAKTGLHALFRLTQPTTAGPQMSRSEAFLFTHGKWFIKYRLTYPEAHAEQCARDIKAFMETLKWPEGS
ncbi:MAG: hypothetical protein ACLQVA_19605 [Candidatus Brocadiia bacterium]